MNERKSIKVTSVSVERDLYGAVSKRDIHGENSNLLHFSYIAKLAFIITSLFHRFNNMTTEMCPFRGKSSTSLYWLTAEEICCHFI